MPWNWRQTQIPWQNILALIKAAFLSSLDGLATLLFPTYLSPNSLWHGFLWSPLYSRKCAVEWKGHWPWVPSPAASFPSSTQVSSNLRPSLSLSMHWRKELLPQELLLSIKGGDVCEPASRSEKYYRNRRLCYSFPITAVKKKKDHKLSVWKNTKFFSCNSGGQNSKIGLIGLNSRHQQGCVPSGSSRGEFISLTFPASKGGLHSLAHGCTSLWPPLQFPHRPLWISCPPHFLIKILLITLGPPDNLG